MKALSPEERYEILMPETELGNVELTEKLQLRGLMGPWVCINCGHPGNDEEDVCPSCGTDDMLTSRPTNLGLLAIRVDDAYRGSK